jgi:hypothetical protein
MNGVGNKTRRSFFGQAGAALAAPLAGATALAADGDDVAARLARLEDTNAIRALLAALLAEPARMGLTPDVRGIFADRDDTISVAHDGTATARVSCTVERATPIESCGTLVEMARLQGDGVVKGTERRVLHGSFVRRNGIWEFDHAELRT